MSDAIITVSNLGKKYRLQHQAERIRYSTFRDMLANKVKSIFGNRESDIGKRRSVEDFWALKDVSFEVKRGEVVGIIGRNGAGKSTLLKILSRVTESTTGRVHLRGRVASLLEVGTGFHPELTGSENIFLNGAILGMSRAEIRQKFDEIVAFAEVEKFLDTPVKRYSSGMYVRLAFAIAAHLEPEILIVDEVLAVGDAEFQKKCLGKMQDVAKKEGRTVLFVSHNISAIKSLTTRGILLNAGRIAFDGTTDSAVQEYVNLGARVPSHNGGSTWGSGMHTVIRAVRILDGAGKHTNLYSPGEPLRVEVELETDGTNRMSLEIFLTDASGARLGMASTYQFHGKTLPNEKGTYVSRLELKPLWLASGRYALDVTTSVINVSWDHYVESAFEFGVPFSNPHGCQLDFKQSYGFGPLALLSAEQNFFSPIDAYKITMGT